MANLYTTVPYKGRPDDQSAILLLKQAEEEYDWECLKPYPMLLVMYQGKHKDKALEIARWVSHFRMPFIPPDVVRSSATFKDYSGNPVTKYFTRGNPSYGHKLCKPDCGNCDYITGERTVEPLPF